MPMKKLFLLALLLPVLTFGYARNHVAATPTPAPVVETLSTTPIVTGDKITFICTTCTDREKKNIAIVQAALPKIINSECAYERFVNVKYRSKLLETNGLSRIEVVQKIRNSVVQNIPIEFYYPSWKQSKNVIGYTYPAAPTIYLNRNFRQGNAWGACAEISNELHEVTHKMGFSHDFKATANRPYSVPYTANYVIDECCNDKDYPGYGN